jgi:hypothetical protein
MNARADKLSWLMHNKTLPPVGGCNVGLAQEPNGQVQRLAGEMVFRWYSPERKTSLKVNYDEY